MSWPSRIMRALLVALVLYVSFVRAHLVHAQTPPPVEDRLGFKVSLELGVGADHVLIERILACEMRTRMHAGPDGAALELRRRPIWEPSARNFQVELRDGSILIVFTPLVCDTHAKRLKDVPPGYVPTLAWLDKKKQFEVVEFYVSPRYFQRPDAKVRFIKLEISHASVVNTSPPDPELEQLRLGGQRFDARDYIDGRFYLGLVAFSYPENVWRENRSITHYVEKLSEFTKITDPVVRREVASLRQYPHSLHNQAEGLGVNFGAYSRMNYASSLQLKDDHWRLNVTDHGVVRLHYRPLSKPDKRRWSDFLQRMRRVDLSLNGRPVSDTTPTVYYDPTTKHLHFISSEYLLW